MSIIITFKNAIKTYFSDKKYTVSIQTRLTQIENNIFVIKTRF